jgi:hypothetical protein
MTTFDEKVVLLGILSNPQFFEGADAWKLTPVNDICLSLVPGWAERFLPVLAPRFPAGFEHACLRHIAVVGRRARGERMDGIVAAESPWPAGILVLGSYASLISMLHAALESEYPKITPIEYCNSLYIDDDGDPESLSYLHEPPSENDLSEVRRNLEALESLGERLDRNRPWALFAGDPDDVWSSNSSLSEARQAASRR